MVNWIHRLFLVELFRGLELCVFGYVGLFCDEKCSKVNVYKIEIYFSLFTKTLFAVFWCGTMRIWLCGTCMYIKKNIFSFLFIIQHLQRKLYSNCITNIGIPNTIVYWLLLKVKKRTTYAIYQSIGETNFTFFEETIHFQVVHTQSTPIEY